MTAPTFNNQPNELITTTDGRQLYHSRSVAVVLVLVAKIGTGYFYAIEKRGELAGLDCPGLWCLPCGYLDWNETATEAVRREAWEEIGLDLRQFETGALLGTSLEQPWFVSSTPSHNRQNVTLRFGLIFETGTLPPLRTEHPHEVADARWIKLGETSNFPFAFQHDQVMRTFAEKHALG